MRRGAEVKGGDRRRGMGAEEERREEVRAAEMSDRERDPVREAILRFDRKWRRV